MKTKFTSPLFAFALTLCLAPGKSAHANEITLTGAELFELASFPTVGATVSGTSLIFDPTTIDFQKLFVLPLSPRANYLISMNLTRLSRDHDPNLVIGNGTSMVGVGAYDQSSTSGQGHIYDDGGNVGLNPRERYFSAAMRNHIRALAVTLR
jgi:hypothetical protein